MKKLFYLALLIPSLAFGAGPFQATQNDTNVILGPIYVFADTAITVEANEPDHDLASLVITCSSPQTTATYTYQDVDGVHDGGANQSLFTDSGESFPVDAFIGLTIFNVTDGSSGTITDNDGTTVTATLSGGTDDDWDNSDVAEIDEIINVSSARTHDDPGSVQGVGLHLDQSGEVFLHFHDDLWSVSNWKQWGCRISDGGTVIMDAPFIVWNIADSTSNKADFQTVLETNNLDHWGKVLMTGTDCVDGAFCSLILSDDVTPDFDSYDNTTDSFEALQIAVAANATALTTAQVDLTIITGTSGALLDTDAIDDDSINAAQTELASAAALTAAQAILDVLAFATGTTDSGTTTTAVDAAAFTSADADYYAKGFAIMFTNGTLDKQSACIYDFDPATDKVTFRPALTQAVSTHTYILLATPICGLVIAP